MPTSGELREAADAEARQWFTDAALSTNDPGICGMLEALRLELRALGIQAEEWLRLDWSRRG